MARLVVMVDVDTDPTLVDPHTVAEDVVDAYENDRAHGFNAPAVTFVSAEWAT